MIRKLLNIIFSCPEPEIEDLELTFNPMDRKDFERLREELNELVPLKDKFKEKGGEASGKDTP